MINKGRHGVGFMFGAFELFILLLADDVILVSETVVGLQTQLNSCLLYTSPSPRDSDVSRMPSSA